MRPYSLSLKKPSNKRKTEITQAAQKSKNTSLVITLHTDICCTSHIFLLKICDSENTYHMPV